MGEEIRRRQKRISNVFATANVPEESPPVPSDIGAQQHRPGAGQRGDYSTPDERLADAFEALNESPGCRLAAVTGEDESGDVRVRIVWRNGNTCELTFPKAKWDPLLFLQAVEDSEVPGRFTERMAELAAAEQQVSRPSMRG